MTRQFRTHISGRLAVLYAELDLYSRDVAIERLGRDKQGSDDFGVGLSFADQLEHLAFTRREPVRAENLVHVMRPGDIH